MCGRFVGSFSAEALVAELIDAVEAAGLVLDQTVGEWERGQNFNVAPTQVVPVLVADDDHIVVNFMRWGLVPKWSKDPSIGSKMINARSETLTEKPSFKGLVARHRCVVPIDGFYEWDRTDPKAKIPYFVPRRDGHLMLVAGLWTETPCLDDQKTFTMITRESRGDLAHIHNRSPVEFESDDALEWLVQSPAPIELLEIAEQPEFEPRKVSTKVNSIRNNGPELIVQDIASDATPDTGNPTLF